MVLKSRDVKLVEPELVEVPILAPEGLRFTRYSAEFAVSPDGRHVAFVATSNAARRFGSDRWPRSILGRFLALKAHAIHSGARTATR